MARRPEPTISAVLIVKDEEEYLARCLDSVTWVDEIVVYDTGSTDRTVAIAREFTDTVVEGYWNDDFGAARNRALARATSDWVLIVDADETFEGTPRAVRKHLARGRGNFLTVTVTTRVAAPGAVETPVVSVRVFRRADGHYLGALHEQVVPRAGIPMRTAPLPGAAIRHSGYSEGPEAMAARVERNLAIAERDVAGAEEADGADLALRKANLARTLSAAGRGTEALDLAEELHGEGVLAGPAAELLAHSMALSAARLANHDLARTWVGRLRAVVGNPVWADALLVQLAAQRGDAPAALDALDCIPTTMVDSRGRQVRRADYAAYEVWALWRLGRIEQARAVAERAARVGAIPGNPVQLWEWLGEPGVARMVGELPTDTWQLLAVACTQAGTVRGARHVLDVMARVRPGDLATLLCAGRLSFPDDLAGLEEAAGWSARMRGAGLAEYCPLITIATDDAAPATQRARAAALAHFAYTDPRALPALETALAEVPPEDEAELATQLDVLAPGLVQHA